jgi:hypothetical protein
MELGRLYERRKEAEEAWICYDHVQNLRAHQTPRDDFMHRLHSRMDGGDKQQWSKPPVSKRQEFLDQMVLLAGRVSEPAIAYQDDEQSAEIENKEEQKLIQLIQQSNFSEAFFVARRLVASGEEWALEYYEQAKQGLD